MLSIVLSMFSSTMCKTFSYVGYTFRYSVPTTYLCEAVLRIGGWEYGVSKKRETKEF